MTSGFEEPKDMKKYYPIVFGQALSMFGTAQTAFAMGIWVLKETGSVLKFAIVLTFMGLGAVISAPIAGTIVDRYDRKMLMIFSDAVAGGASVLLAVLFYVGTLEFWHLCAYMTVVSIMGGLQGPALSASFRFLVPMKDMGRAVGIMQSSISIGKIASPLSGAFLLEYFGFGSVIIADFATFFIGVFVLVFVKIPSPDRHPDQPTPSFMDDMKGGFTYLFERKPLMIMMVFSFLGILFLTMWDGLFVPMFLTMSDVTTLGALVSIVGFGSLAGSLLMAAWGGPRVERMPLLIWLGVLQGVLFAAFAVTQNTYVFGVLIFLLFGSLPLASAMTQVILQYKVDPIYQGRVFAFNGLLRQLAMPIAYIVVGPLAEKVFEPAMVEGGSLTETFGTIVGIGEGRGIAVFLLLIGAFYLVYSLIHFLLPRVRKLDTEMPDAQMPSQMQAPPEEAPDVEGGQDASPESDGNDGHGTEPEEETEKKPD